MLHQSSMWWDLANLEKSAFKILFFVSSFFSTQVQKQIMGTTPDAYPTHQAGYKQLDKYLTI